jgi:ribose transport system ATP-binding protein
MAQMSDLLELRSITKTYPGVTALDDVSVSFRRGEVHAIIGENGAGKSTLIKVVSGAETADSGSIVLDGEVRQDVVHQRDYPRRVPVRHRKVRRISHDCPDTRCPADKNPLTALTSLRYCV